MARLREDSVVRQFADAEKARADFILCMKKGSLDLCGEERQIYLFLAKKLGICYNSTRKYVHQPESMPVEVLTRLVKVMKPDIFLLLRFLGYKESEIKKFVKERAV